MNCGGAVRPGVVWFGEDLLGKVMSHAIAATRDCDVLIVIGTSGLVEPAARLPHLAMKAGAQVVQVNPSITPLDDACTWSLRGAAGSVIPTLLQTAFPSASQGG